MLAFSNLAVVSLYAAYRRCLRAAETGIGTRSLKLGALGFILLLIYLLLAQVLRVYA